MLNVSPRMAPWLLPIIELFLIVATTALVLLRRRREEAPGISGLRSLSRRLAPKRALSVLAVGVFTLAIRAALIPILGVPQPGAHDEFSYLLAADTFAHGNVANPPHPMSVHFETFHVIQQPSYASMYPPAQGLVLAFGQILGHPWIGEWLVTGLMCSAICWMLQGWLPPAWALCGASLASLRLGILTYWMNGYWSSSLVALGGALILGALPRMRRRGSLINSAVMALGLGILANSRPYEGLVLALIVAGALVMWRRKPADDWRTAFKLTVAPLAPLLLLAGAATGWYYYRVTGSPFRMAYQVEAKTTNPVPFFLWQAPRPEPTYHHAVMRSFYEEDLRKFVWHRTLSGFLFYCFDRAAVWWTFYLGPLLTIPLLALPRVLRERKMRFPLIGGGVFLLALVGESWGLPHYVAPATGLLFLVLAQCARHMAFWTWGGRRIGRTVVYSIPVLLCGMLILRVAAVALHSQIESPWPRGNLERAALLHQLQQTPGEHLVFVTYAPDHDPNAEWVYNRADIDGSQIVWAHDMGEKANRELLKYFPQRRVWMVKADERPPRLSPWPELQED